MNHYISFISFSSVESYERLYVWRCRSRGRLARREGVSPSLYYTYKSTESTTMRRVVQSVHQTTTTDVNWTWALSLRNVEYSKRVGLTVTYDGIKWISEAENLSFVWMFSPDREADTVEKWFYSENLKQYTLLKPECSFHLTSKPTVSVDLFIYTTVLYLTRVGATLLSG